MKALFLLIRVLCRALWQSVTAPSGNYKIADRLKAEFTNIRDSDRRMLAGAVSRGEMSFKEYSVLGHPPHAAYNLSFVFVENIEATNSENPLVTATELDLVEGLSPSQSYNVLLGYALHGLSQIMINKPEIQEIAGCSFEELVAKFAEATGHSKDDLDYEIKRCGEHLNLHGGDPVWAKHETINDFLSSILKNPPPSSPTGYLGMLFSEVFIETTGEVNSFLIEKLGDK